MTRQRTFFDEEFERDMAAKRGEPQKSIDNRKCGENVSKLAIRFTTVRVIPKGGGLADGIAWLSNPDAVKRDLRAGFVRAFAAIDEIKAATDNPFGDDDEAIAGAILARVEEIIAERRKSAQDP